MNKDFWKAKEIPFFLTLLFGILGYTVNMIADQIINSDIIEYKFSNQNYQKENALRFIISNLSTSKTYQNLNFSMIRSKQDTIQFKEGYLVPKEPFSESFTRLNPDNKRAFFSDNVNFKINNLLPGATFHLIVTYKNGSSFQRPLLNININDPASDHFNTKTESPYILESNWQTSLAKNNLLILVALVVLWSVLIISYLKFISIS